MSATGLSPRSPQGSRAAAFVVAGEQVAKDVRGARRQDIAMDFAEYIASALKTEGGHLSIGHERFSLHYGDGARLIGYDSDHLKACCIKAGLPVIDSRMVEFDEIVRLAVKGPLVAVGQKADPPPWHSLSYAPLAVVADAYRAAGAEVFNIPTQAGETKIGEAP